MFKAFIFTSCVYNITFFKCRWLQSLYSFDSLFDSDLDLQQAIDSPTNLRLVIAYSTSQGSLAMVLSNCQWFELDVVEVYDCHCHYGLAVSDTDKMLSMSQHLQPDCLSRVESVNDAVATADEVVSECCYTGKSMQPMKVLNE